MDARVPSGTRRTANVRREGSDQAPRFRRDDSCDARTRLEHPLLARLGNARRSDATCVFVDEPRVVRGDERAFQSFAGTRDRGGERKYDSYHVVLLVVIP